ncbi:MAG: hypothetical protein JW697_05995 [Kosmotogaceae bacterium]|nr:hypothetical protein [Kosmotogaceae bacterium]
MKFDNQKNLIVVLAALVLLTILTVSSCGEKPNPVEEKVTLSREEILALSGLEESEISFTKIKLDVSGKPVLNVSAYDGEGREIFSKDFPQSEVKGGYVTVAVIKSEIIDALRLLYAVTDSKGNVFSFVQDFPYFQYQEVKVDNGDYSHISSKGEFKLTSVAFGQEKQDIFLNVK